MRILHTSDWHLGRIFHGVYLPTTRPMSLSNLSSWLLTAGRM